ncbi:MAG: hypothetical protein ABR577_16150 [Pyrinomonadaceae bacterium]
MQDTSDELIIKQSAKTGRQAFSFASDTATRAVYLIVGAATIALVFYKLQFTTDAICCGDNDPYYHIRWSSLLWEGMRTGHFPPVFKWLPLTTLNPKDYDDHHLLFHILQIPFTWFGNIQLGAKIAATLFSTLALLSCYFLIVRFRIRYTLLWLIALLGCSAPFLYRMNMGKAMSLSIIFVSAGIYLLFTRKYIWLAPLGFLYVWTYSLWPLLGVAALIWAGVILWSERKLEWRPVVWVSVGCLAGLVINPYFPNDIKLLVEHILIKVKPGDFSTQVGGEWYPYNSWEFLQYCFIAFVAMFTGYVAFNSTDKENGKRPLFFLVFSTVLLVLNARWRRSVEYWPPFAILFAAFTLQPILSGARRAVNQLPTDVLDDLQPFLDRHELPEAAEAKERETWAEGESTIVGVGLSVALYFILMPWDAHKMVRGIAAFIVLALGIALYYKFRGTLRTIAATIALGLGIAFFANVSFTARDIKDNAKADHFQAGMQWMRANVPADQMIFNINWDMFPKLFFYDTTHPYVSGLDPTYLLDKDADLAKLYENITLGKVKDPGPLIRDRFGSRYVFTDSGHEDFYNNAADSGWFEKVYEDDECTILHIRDQKGAPLPDDEGDQGDDSDDGGGDDAPQDEEGGA